MNESCPIDHQAAERAAETLPNPLRRWLHFSVGAVSVVLGVIGILVPLWPTTCFLLLAGWCFARSSHRAERWLHENRLFGPYLRDYREKGVISSRIRTTTVMTLWACMGLSAFLLWERLWIVALLVLIGGAVTVHLFSLPTASKAVSSD
ncbi:MAG TPA: YbaN family protein [Longimicrobiales bacterium]|nr:YbaN family protein [Longimicrobiales bacterium]